MERLNAYASAPPYAEPKILRLDELHNAIFQGYALLSVNPRRMSFGVCSRDPRSMAKDALAVTLRSWDQPLAHAGEGQCGLVDLLSMALI